MSGLTPSAPGGDGKGTCPVLENPEPDCYCINLTSLTIPIAVKYCLNDYRQCHIYSRCMGFPAHGAPLSTIGAPAAWAPVGIGTEEICPVLENPEPDCYFINPTSMTIAMVNQYCARDFKQCPIYRRCMGTSES